VIRLPAGTVSKLRQLAPSELQALDAAHAQDIARAQHPSGRLSAVLAELLDGQDHHQLLRAWLRDEG